MRRLPPSDMLRRRAAAELQLLASNLLEDIGAGRGAVMRLSEQLGIGYSLAFRLARGGIDAVDTSTVERVALALSVPVALFYMTDDEFIAFNM